MRDSSGTRAWLAAACVALGACGHHGELAPREANDAHDAPIAEAEPRATVRVRLDLQTTSDCEERFDLELYRDRGIELVDWEPAAAGTCEKRRATIRFVPGRISRDRLKARIEKLGANVEVLDP